MTAVHPTPMCLHQVRCLPLNRIGHAVGAERCVVCGVDTHRERVPSSADNMNDAPRCYFTDIGTTIILLPTRSLSIACRYSLADLAPECTELFTGFPPIWWYADKFEHPIDRWDDDDEKMIATTRAHLSTLISLAAARVGGHYVK